MKKMYYQTGLKNGDQNFFDMLKKIKENGQLISVSNEPFYMIYYYQYENMIIEYIYDSENGISYSLEQINK